MHTRNLSSTNMILFRRPSKWPSCVGHQPPFCPDVLGACQCLDTSPGAMISMLMTFCWILAAWLLGSDDFPICILVMIHVSFVQLSDGNLVNHLSCGNLSEIYIQTLSKPVVWQPFSTIVWQQPCLTMPSKFLGVPLDFDTSLRKKKLFLVE